jgi:hypothetical protein
MRKHYRCLLFNLVIEASTAFRLLTLLPSVLIVAALPSVQRILVRVSKSAYEKLVCKITLGS